MKLLTTILLLIEVVAVAGEREPLGSKTSWLAATNGNQIVLHMHNDTSGSNWIVNAGSVPISLPHTYRDVSSGTILYVESDGRHVTAIAPDGKILWSRDPFADAHLKFYRTHSPRIVSFDKIDMADKDHNWMLRGKTGRYIAISFNSTQSGIVDIKTGEFTFMGQD